MPTFIMPVIVNDSDGNTGTVIGATPVFLGGVNPPGVILASALSLFGAGGVKSGRERLRFLAEPGIVDIIGDDATTIRLDTSGTISIDDGHGAIRVALNREGNIALKDGQFSITDTNDKTRLVADASGKLTLTDDSGNFAIVLDAQRGSLRITNSSPEFGSSVLLESAGRITLSADAPGGQTVLSASGEASIFSNSVSFKDNIGVGGGAVFENNVEVHGDVVLTGADCAEHFDVVCAHELEPGTVVVIDATGGLTQSRHAYDRKVAGILSGAGDLRPAIILDQQDSAVDRMPLALIGKVHCKVDADFSPIAVGDLLTTSETPGHAMRADDPARGVGAIIGKALQPLSSGRGLIPVLIALQ